MTNLGRKGIDEDVQNCLHNVTSNRQKYGTFEYIPLDMLVNILHVYTPQIQRPSPTTTETSKIFVKGFENRCTYTTVEKLLCAWKSTAFLVVSVVVWEGLYRMINYKFLMASFYHFNYC